MDKNIENMENTMDEDAKQMNAVKSCICAIIVLFLTPLMVCDLYYGFSGDECLDEYPEQIHLNLKKYLIVCGFTTLFIMIYMIIITTMMTTNDDKNTVIMVVSIGISFTMGILMLVWNIMGAIIFWQFIFPEHNCNESVSNYLFASIIIKLVLTWTSLASKSSNRD